MGGFSSFGRPEPEPRTRDARGDLPVPVLHVGEVHAELRLVVTDETLSDLGSQIASLIARATREGFAAGLAAAMGDAAGDDDGEIHGQVPQEADRG